ncbi:TPA: DUF3077 domain-containing protein [Pseudomonas aeruginosa]|uniref:DUF3077 domain-containing protein n=1 Tax=Pseudomonas aeruginosa TaxID=287 RepID=UPI00071B2A5C|nr:DUF3077 domain-containing protein [Pseudomonas aeruginosa]KSJ59745.1 hypothetical protein AO997_17295 [Pseudomonas aeruginosa]WQO16716.1 DUF3077 domain-containing protein [Pseudomonas aeruginosa]HBN9494590.1 DUF3077 domain-containing protein [Pseudomonas aeruginosa]HCC4914450.1 DUF3077 domain-containing protein [Pseudomonas aeruginosa]HCF0888584.1 DUF3077 domain-containing protein [Pseudomonas aeruginosa]
MNALLRARPIDPENSFFKVNPGLSKREALDEASVILAGLSDILISLVEGSPMDGNGYALAYLSDAAKALVDAAIPLPAEEAEIAAALNAKERRQ